MPDNKYAAQSEYILSLKQKKGDIDNGNPTFGDDHKFGIMHSDIHPPSFCFRVVVGVILQESSPARSTYKIGVSRRVSFGTYIV